MTSEGLRQMLKEGDDLIVATGKRYRSQLQMIKTFFFICECLASRSDGSLLKADSLREYICSCLNLVDTKFNPLGFFGKGWTDSDSPAGSPYFREEFAVVLNRDDSDPYSYSIAPGYYEVVRAFFSSRGSSESHR